MTMSLAPRRRFRAPTEDCAALFDPPLAEVPALIAANQALGREFDSRAGFPSGFRQEARGLAVMLAPTSPPRGAALANVDSPVILSGHQPELFHPGVWLKNFVLSAIAERAQGIALNLVIDNDVVHATSIRVPTAVASGWPQVVEVPFDAPGERIPWARRSILDPAAFITFRSAVRRAGEGLLGAAGTADGLLLDRMWPHALAAQATQRANFERLIRQQKLGQLPDGNVSRFINLGQCLATARHQLEREIGLQTAEHLLSWVADHHFLTFAAHLLARHRELHAIHNDVLADYRLQNGIRNAAQPVPDLAREGDWYEVPLWVWSWADPKAPRRRAFVRQVGKSWELSDLAGLTIPDWSRAENPPLELMQHQMQVLPRALITTMYARLVLSDLFIHGIGGAKYDEVTDEIIRRFFGLEPPRYLTATATFRLPIERPQVAIEDLRDNSERLRNVRYRPESFVGDPLLAGEPALENELAALAAEKRDYLARHKPRRRPREVFAGLDAINRAMHERLAPVEEHLRREQARLAEEWKTARVLGSREFSFVLFPEDYLVPRLLELARLPA
ncbi:MAG: hypothetical protein SFU86_08810 [Pirellulaceae bacterium]|nr:hypothetical protein [Pirellulaceae bacterium]